MTNWMYLTLAAVLLSVSGFSVDLKLSDLQNKLNQNSDGNTWVAGETELSQLSNDELRRRMGAILPEGFGEFTASAPEINSNTSLDASDLDWRDYQGKNYTPPVMNQGRCGSCVAFAAVATLEAQLNITRKTPQSPWAFSPQHLFACGGGGCETGWQPMSAVSFLKSKGVPDEACFPYESGAMGKDAACTSTCSNAAARSEKIVEGTMPSFFFPNPAAVKEALKKGPLMATMRVHEDFVFYKGGVYKHTTGKALGGHAIMLVGYNDAEKYWILQNSWGEEWGENGYFRVHYDDDSGIGSMTNGMVVSEGAGYITLGGLRDYTVLKGNVKVNIESTLTGVQALEWTLSKDGVPAAWGTARKDGEIALESSKYSDGVYSIHATARLEGKTVESAPRKVFILNGAFTGKLEPKEIKSGDVLTEEKKFPVDVTASPIPFTKLVFKTKNLSTGEVSVRGTGVTYPKMQIGWRAQLVANGDYELVIEGYVGNKMMASTEPIKVKVQHAK
jgi:C1A family cysteine protease